MNLVSCNPILRPLSLAILAITLVSGTTSIAGAAEEPLKVCLVSGSLEYKSNESLAAFQEFLEANYPVKCSRAFIVGKDEEHLPGLENLEHCDVMVLFTRRLKLSGDELARIKDYCLSGRPIVGVRTASHAIQSWLDLDKEVLGGDYKGHYGHDSQTDITILDAAKDHPVLAGVTSFRSDGTLYKNPSVSADVTVLMTGTIPEHTEPITWIRDYKGARIFYSSLGHPHDFAEPGFRRLLVNALFWTTGRPVPSK